MKWEKLRIKKPKENDKVQKPVNIEYCSNLEVGTKSLTDTYKKATPGQ